MLPRLQGVEVRDVKTGKISEIAARYVILAEGAASRLSRELGASRDKQFPLGMALRGYYASPRHDDPFIESYL
ncbi:geranylgeranyl reductase, partial [mine drainage metagenome]